MSRFWDTVKRLLLPSGIEKIPFHTLRTTLTQWQQYQTFSAYSVLPSAITFSSDFWTRVLEIYRHTAGDGHERAVTVWWADGEFVLTENIRGKTARVHIPKQNIKVTYNPIKGTRRYERIILVNGKTYSKRTVDIETVKRVKKLEVEYLFNMHTHPPHSEPEQGLDKLYYFFSAADIRGFLYGDSVITGLVTDKLWLLIKTSETPKTATVDDSGIISPQYLSEQLNIKVYKAEFGKAAISKDILAAHEEQR